MMSGESNLKVLLASLDPEISRESYIFCTMKIDIEEIIKLDPWAIIKEKEGYTAIVAEKMAKKHEIGFEELYKRITLNVHSSLGAVGLTAILTTELAKACISSNMVAAYYHDHIFVPKEKAKIALTILRNLERKES